MALEDLEGPDKFLDALVITNPEDQDKVKFQAGHSRGIKNVLINTFGARSQALDVFSEAHPVGSIYLSMGIDPNTLAGTWTRIAEGRMLIGVGTLGSDTYVGGNTGGSATHTLTEAEMPAHSHDRPQVVGGSGSNAGLTGNVASVTGAHASSTVGGGAAHENRPPYLAVDIWQRTA